jgi:hypothetical protein
MAPFEIVLERAIGKGNINVGKRSTADFIAELVGPLFFRRWFSREKVDTAFLRSIIEMVVRAHE